MTTTNTIRLATVKSNTRVLDDRPIRDIYEIYSRNERLYVRMPNWPGVARVEPLEEFLQRWHTGRCLWKIFYRAGHQRFGALDGATIESCGDHGEVHGSELDGTTF